MRGKKVGKTMRLFIDDDADDAYDAADGDAADDDHAADDSDDDDDDSDGDDGQG